MERMDRKTKQRLTAAIEIAVESLGVTKDQKTIEQISDFAVARLDNPQFDGENPYTKGNYNVTKQMKLEEENPELAAMLEKEAKLRGL